VKETIWEVLFFRSRLPISDQIASGSNQAQGDQVRLGYLDRACEHGGVHFSTG
jgi:hypothetical protein